MEMKIETKAYIDDKSQTNMDPMWLPYADLFVNSVFFKRGIVIISPTDAEENVKDSEVFLLNDREFAFSSSSSLPDARALKNTTNLLSKLVTYSLTQGINIQVINETSKVLFNKRRREEVFFPLILEKDIENHTGLYLYPWTNGSSKSYQFTGFTQFVTAGCMFGASMRAITQDGVSLELINHQIRLNSEQIIQSIDYEVTQENPFEMVLFEEFEKTCLLINTFSKVNQSKKLLYHLPASDYILFGIKLFINKQMTFEALDSFVQAIYLKQDEYQEKLLQQCNQYQIEIIFLSPFDNLFATADRTMGAKSIIDILEIDKININQTEENIVRKCLYRLQHNTTHIDQLDVWQDFIPIDEKKCCDIESLFKIANAIVIGIASKNRKSYEVCSLLPLSEKQIQIRYNECQKKIKQTNNYPPIVNFTLFDPVVTYAPMTNGLLFYFSYCLNTLCKLLANKEITKKATKNITLFGNNKKHTVSQSAIELASILDETKKTYGY